MFVASVSTLLFNANPLLRFDGYYILSDLLGVPNLYGRSRQFIRSKIEKILFNAPDEENIAHNRRESVWFVVYGLASAVFRVFVVAGIILFIADQFLLLGTLFAISILFSSLVVPPFKFIQISLQAAPVWLVAGSER